MSYTPITRAEVPMPIKRTTMGRLVPPPPPMPEPHRPWPRPKPNAKLRAQFERDLEQSTIEATRPRPNPFSDINGTIQQIMDLLDPEGAMSRVRREQLAALFSKPRGRLAVNPSSCPFPAEWLEAGDLQPCPLCGGLIVPGVVHLRPEDISDADWELLNGKSEDKAVNEFEEI